MTAWKDLERRVCRALGAERRPSVGPRGWARGSDDDGTAPFAVEVKRTKRLQLRAAWVEQARSHSRSDGRPWLIVMAEHRSQRPVAVLDFDTLVALGHKAGIIRVTDEGGSMSETEIPQPPDEPTDDDDDGSEDERLADDEDERGE